VRGGGAETTAEAIRGERVESDCMEKVEGKDMSWTTIAGHHTTNAK